MEIWDAVDRYFFSNEMRRVSCSMWRKLSKGVNPQLLNMLVNFDLRPFGGWKEFLQDIFHHIPQRVGDFSW